ncbi:MAG: nucleotidyltransferase family protein [Eubacteriales bacterium]|nr:nucleotidyltransferase family protein [Eubacteriales bacterium]
MDNKKLWTLYRSAFKHIPLSLDEITDISTLYNDIGRDKVFSCATRKKILPAISALMVKLEIEESYWKPYTLQFRERNLRILDCLSYVYSSLYSAGVNKMVVVENFGALLSSEEDLAMFGSGDVDNYADINQKELIYKVLRNLGFSITEIKAGDILISSAFKKEGFLPENIYFGINWDITCRTNLPCLTSKEEFIDWNNLIYYKDTAIRMPPLEALMYICMMHIAVHGFSRAPDIRLYYDIANIERSSLNWFKIKDWAIRDENSTRIATVGFLSKQLLGVTVPGYILSMGNNAQKRHLINLVFDQTNNRLIDFPNKLTTLGIDVFSNDNGSLQGFKDVVTPNKIWLNQRYGNSKKAFYRHIINLI